jgi:hypothetical protein
LSTQFQFIDWNPAFDEIAARALNLRRGMHVAAFVGQLANCEEVSERATEVFRPGAHPLVDFEPLVLETAAYGLVRFQKTASEILDRRGVKQAWAVTLSVVRADRQDALWADVHARLERESAWLRYALARNRVLANAGVGVSRRTTAALRGAARALALGASVEIAPPEDTELWIQDDHAILVDDLTERLAHDDGRFTVTKEAVDHFDDYAPDSLCAVVGVDPFGPRREADFKALNAVLRHGGKLALVLRVRGAGDAALAGGDELAAAAAPLDRIAPRPTAAEIGRDLQGAGFKIEEWDDALLGGTFLWVTAEKR